MYPVGGITSHRGTILSDLKAKQFDGTSLVGTEELKKKSFQ